MDDQRVTLTAEHVAARNAAEALWAEALLRMARDASDPEAQANAVALLARCGIRVES